MPKKHQPTGTDKDLNLATMAELFSDESKARAFLEAKRWPDGPVCPRCNCTEVYTLTPKEGSASPVRPGVYKCKGCRQQFTVRIGTIFEESKIPLSKWLMAIHLMTSSKKGVSSHQIARELGITVKSAWFVTHRIREAMKEEPMATMLEGTVEVDETYVGGKPRKGDGKEHKRGRGTPKKPVMVLVERDGDARAMPIERVDSKTLRGEIIANVARESTVVTDDFPAYSAHGGISKSHAAHEIIRHIGGEYSRTNPDGFKVNTNTAESFFALLKRGHYGIFHQLSKKHLHRYTNEFAFRWNQRKVTDGERMTAAIRGAKGKRLFYREPVKGLTA
jgi:transposase-like protein